MKRLAVYQKGRILNKQMGKDQAQTLMSKPKLQEFANIMRDDPGQQLRTPYHDAKDKLTTKGWNHKFLTATASGMWPTGTHYVEFTHPNIDGVKITVIVTPSGETIKKYAVIQESTKQITVSKSNKFKKGKGDRSLETEVQSGGDTNIVVVRVKPGKEMWVGEFPSSKKAELAASAVKDSTPEMFKQIQKSYPRGDAPFKKVRKSSSRLFMAPSGKIVRQNRQRTV